MKKRYRTVVHCKLKKMKQGTNRLKRGTPKTLKGLPLQSLWCMCVCLCAGYRSQRWTHRHRSLFFNIVFRTISTKDFFSYSKILFLTVLWLFREFQGVLALFGYFFLLRRHRSRLLTQESKFFLIIIFRIISRNMFFIFLNFDLFPFYDI